MTHASLCKKTYKSIERFHSTKSRRMAEIRSLAIAILFSLASVCVLSAQCTNNITPTSVASGTVGTPYSVNLTENESFGMFPVTWGLMAGSLPPGLTLDTATTSTTTSITGTPIAAGIYPFEVEAEYNSSAQTLSCQSYTIVVVAACSPTLSPDPSSPLPPGDVNVPYPQLTFMVSGCTGGSFTFSVEPVDPFSQNSLPPGLSLNSGRYAERNTHRRWNLRFSGHSY